MKLNMLKLLTGASFSRVRLIMCLFAVAPAILGSAWAGQNRHPDPTTSDCEIRRELSKHIPGQDGDEATDVQSNAVSAK